LYGGFSSQKVKGDNEKSVTLADQWTLNLNNMTWVSRKKLGIPPSVRSGQAAAVWTAKRRLYTFGGVSDSDVGLDLVSVFHNDAHWLSIQPDDASSAPAAATSQLRWSPFELQAPTRAKGKKEHDRFRERMAARTKLDGFAEVHISIFSTDTLRHQQLIVFMISLLKYVAPNFSLASAALIQRLIPRCCRWRRSALL
jgi:hypothetical protein